MAKARGLVVFSVLVLAAPAAVLADAVVVYDNTTYPMTGNWVSAGLPRGFWPFSYYEAQGVPIPDPIGDQVTLAGTCRNITKFELSLTSSQRVVLPELTLKLYLNDGLDCDFQEGAPGSLLWTGTLTDFTVDGLTTATFSLPGVLVPDNFTWVAAGDSRNAGPALFNPPTVGRDGEGYWDYDVSGVWVGSFFMGDPISNFGARITAVPEPCTLALLGAGAALVLRRRRRCSMCDFRCST